MVSVYVSYAWKEEEQNRLVDKLEQTCTARGIELLRDKRTIGYGDSIRKFMDEIGAGRHVVLVLSDAYLRSRHCMLELREVHRRGDLRERVLPIILRGTCIDDPEDRVTYFEHWEKKRSTLEQRLAAGGRARTTNLSAAVDDYYDFRGLVDDWLGTLADMNALTQEVHVGTDFACLIERILKQIAGDSSERWRFFRRPDEEFLSTAEAEIRRALLALPRFADMLGETARQVGLAFSGDLAHSLCAGKLQTVLSDVLRPTTESALRHTSAQTMRDSPEWKAAKTLLLWLSLFAVNPEWVKQRENVEKNDSGAFDVFVKTSAGVEIVSSRYRQVCPAFLPPRGMDLVGKGRIPLSPLESGWSNDNTIRRILLDVAKQLFPEFTQTILTNDEFEDLKETLNDTLIEREKQKSHQYYLSVGMEDDSPLTRRDLYEDLINALPALTVIYRKSSGGSTALLVDRESRLITIIREFLTIPELLGKKP